MTTNRRSFIGALLAVPFLRSERVVNFYLKPLGPSVPIRSVRHYTVPIEDRYGYISQAWIDYFERVGR